MRTDLDHLPASKQRELERVVQILFEEFDEARSLFDLIGTDRNSLLREARILKNR